MLTIDPEITWAEEWLASHTYRVLGEPSLIHTVPWSKIYCFETDRGNVYLKWSAPPYAREAVLMIHIAELYPADISPVLAKKTKTLAHFLCLTAASLSVAT